MKLRPLALSAALVLAGSLSTAFAQNIAVVNGKAVPKARVDSLLKQVNAQAAAQGQQLPPDLDQRARDKVVLDEIFYQEAQRTGVLAGEEYKSQLEQARVGLAVQTLFTDFQKKNPVTDAEIQSEYDKLKAQSAGTEYRARHILVEKEDEAKSLITQIKGGAKFEDLAKKHSKDSGSGERGGDLDFAGAGTYVPEFSQAMVKLKKGEMTAEPVKSQFGWHVIRLEDTREAQFPPLAEVKPQLQQRLSQMKLAKYRDDVRAKAKTDYKFSQ
jgi:peptidyl-prolyl cis-trans isomerase C